ncbi:MAG: VWA domain-containing protein [Tepidisphaeraceae bacterium]
MSWLPSFISPLSAAIAAAVVAPLLLLLYFLKLRRKEQKISSTLLWKKAVQDLQVNAPFQKLRRNLLLLLQALLLAALLLALARPVSYGVTPPAMKTIILLDRSASMRAKDIDSGKRTRLDEAKRQAISVVDAMRPGTEAVVIAFDSRAEVVQQRTADLGLLRAAINNVEQTDRPTALKMAYQLAETALALPGENLNQTAIAPDVYVFSDGRASDAADLSLQGNVKYTAIGSDTSKNVGIIALSARRNYERPTEVQVFASLANFGPEPIDAVPLQLSIAAIDPDNPRVESFHTDQVKQATNVLPDRYTEQQRKDAVASGKVPRDTIEFTLELTTGAVIRIEQMQKEGDALAADDVAQVVVPPPRNLSVALVTPEVGSNFYLENAIRTLGLQHPQILSAQQYEAKMPDDVDVIVFDRHKPTRLPPAGNFFYFGCVPPNAPLKQAVDAKGLPIIEQQQGVLDWRRDHPILRGLNIARVATAEALRLDVPPDAQTLIDGEKSPLVVLWKQGRSTHMVVAFDVLQSNWPLRETFQHFLYNTMQFLALGSDMDVRESYAPGDMPRIARVNVDRAFSPGTKEMKVLLRGPDGDKPLIVPQAGDFALPPLDTVGLYKTDPAVPQFERVAVNLLNANESNLMPSKLPPGHIGQAVGAVGEEGSKQSRLEWWWWLVAFGVLPLLMVEWWVYTRRLHA